MVLGRTNKSDNEFQWVDHSCLEPLIQQQFDVAPICQRDTVADSSLTTNAEATKAKSGCLPGWTEYAGHCYLTKTEPKSWSEAEADCRTNRRGHLASFHSEAEFSFVAQPMTSCFWTGGQNSYVLDSESGWSWSDESDWDWAKWVEFPYLSDNSGRHCIMSEMGKGWTDAGCDNRYPYICKI